MPVHSSIYNVISSPWMLLAPSVPLLLILLLKIRFDRPLISILVYCVVTFLIRTFSLINTEIANNLDIIRLFHGLDFFISFILLFNCIDQKKLKHPFITILLVYISIAFCFYKLSNDTKEQMIILQIGELLNFLFAGIILISYLTKTNKNLLYFSNFWFVGGVFIYYGFMSLLSLSPEDLNEYEAIQYKCILLIGYFLFFIIITTGIIIHLRIEFPTLTPDSNIKTGQKDKFRNEKPEIKKKSTLKPYSSKKW